MLLTKKRSIVIEDDITFRLLSELIALQTGADDKIETAATWEDALEIINKYLTGREALPDFVFIKLDMAAMDGIEFIRTIQRIEFPHKRKLTLVIHVDMLSQNERTSMVSAGVNHFVTKQVPLDNAKSLLFSDD